MVQNITIANAAFTDVPAVQIPKTGGGTAVFVDTSDATATAENIVSPYTAYVGGVKVTGSASLGIPTQLSTSSAMSAVLVAANVGKAYLFTGTTDSSYTNGDLYIVEVS